MKVIIFVQHELSFLFKSGKIKQFNKTQKPKQGVKEIIIISLLLFIPIIKKD